MVLGGVLNLTRSTIYLPLSAEKKLAFDIDPYPILMKLADNQNRYEMSDESEVIDSLEISSQGVHLD